jgi:hypothetical protein
MRGNRRRAVSLFLNVDWRHFPHFDDSDSPILCAHYSRFYSTAPSEDTMNQPRKGKTFRKIFASTFDFVMAFWVFGYVIAHLTGGLTGGGFSLKGLPAFFLFALVIAYFVIFNRFFRGTIWRHIFRVPVERKTTD